MSNVITYFVITFIYYYNCEYKEQMNCMTELD